MIRISLFIIGFYLSIVSALAQVVYKEDSTGYKHRKLKTEEVNFATSYYRQDGNNSAVTGGIGTEKLTDVATTFDLQMTKYNRKDRLMTYRFELGVDSYSSASSDKINPATISSSSSNDQRFYPSASLTIANEEKRQIIGFNTAISVEYDYLSFGGGISFTKGSRDNNRELSAKFQSYYDLVTIIFPIELRPDPFGMEPRKTQSASFAVAQVVNKRLQLALLLDMAYQTGYLGMSFHRVFFTDGSEKVENLPDSRFKLPVGVRINYFAGDRNIIRVFYRYYWDDWGMTAHTANIETPFKITPFISISPFYRYHTQSAIDYFAPFQSHLPTEQFFSSDFDLSSLHSHSEGMSFRIVSPTGVLGIKKLNTLEIRYGHYNRSTGLTSNIISLQAKFK